MSSAILSKPNSPTRIRISKSKIKSVVLAHGLGHMIKQAFEGFLFFFLNKCLLNDCYSFNKHVMSAYCASGSVTSVTRNTKMSTARTQSSRSSIGKVATNIS